MTPDPLRVPTRAEMSGLRPAELLILRMIGEGMTDEQIAAKMSRTPHMVRYHVREMKAHLQVSRREVLVRCAVRLGLVPV